VSFLIDTNIISEVRKGDRCEAHVADWYASIADRDLFLSTLVLGEIRKGIELARPRDADKAAVLDRTPHPRRNTPNKGGIAYEVSQVVGGGCGVARSLAGLPFVP
jgi:hypothetical protein